MREKYINDYLKKIVEKSNSDLERIRKLNDLLRLTFETGKVILTIGVYELSLTNQERVMGKVRVFNSFTEDNDPHEEHDFGAVEVDGEKYFWKIDYYSKENEGYGSSNPADPAVTERVLTIMRANEY